VFSFLLSFSGSCLVSYFLSEVWQFMFACCPQVQEISSVVHQLSDWQLAFCNACLLGTCFFTSPPFSGARSVILDPAPCYQRVVIVCCLFFNFAEPFDFGCCNGSGDEFCGQLRALFQAVDYHSPTVGLPTFPAICLLIVHTEISSWTLTSSLVHYQHFHHLCCVLLFS
jgi:hypothetical protein